jgi:Tfp pilus assembly protein PilF
VKDTPGNPEAWLLLGRSLLRKEDFAGAAAALAKAAELAPGIAEAHALLGTAHQYSRKTDEAVAEYEKALELAPDDLDYRATYGLLLGVAGKYEAGAAELQKVVSTPGYKNTAGFTNLGWIYRNMTPPRIEDSVAAYTKALELDPKNEQAALGLGWAYSYKKSWDESIAAFEHAIKIEPKTAGEAHDGMAWCYLFKKDPAKAKELMEKAKSEGRPDARLATSIERLQQLIERGGADTARALEEAEKEREEQRKLEARFEGLNRGLQSKDEALRARAMRDIAGLIGAEQALPYLLRALSQDPSYDVRIAAAQALGSLGARAKIAVPYLKAILTARPYEAPMADATKDELQAELKDADLRRAARDALSRIQ